MVGSEHRAGLRSVRLRGDTDFSLTAHFDRWTEAGVEFDFGIDANPSFVKSSVAGSELERAGPPQQGARERQKAPPPAGQSEAGDRQDTGIQEADAGREEIAEMDYRPSKAKGRIGW